MIVKENKQADSSFRTSILSSQADVKKYSGKNNIFKKQNVNFSKDEIEKKPRLLFAKKRD